MMSELEANLNLVLRVLDHLGPRELAVIEERLAARKQVAEHSPAPASDLFELPFDDYLAMSREERDAIALRAYQTLGPWIDAELKRLGAEWMLVCGGKVIESSPILKNYPSREKLMKIGRQRGLIPFVFVKAPLIEESGWSTLEGDDFYPTVRLTVAASGTEHFAFRTSLPLSHPAFADRRQERRWNGQGARVFCAVRERLATKPALPDQFRSRGARRTQLADRISTAVGTGWSEESDSTLTNLIANFR